jgi:MerR family transcriptional regulator/heat shock protein HspR
MNHKNERSRHIGSAPAAPKPPAEAPQPDAGREPGRETCRGVYHISIVAELVETHPQTLRMYERMGLVSPQRTRNNIRLYSEADVERVRRIQHLTQDLGVNLAGVEVVFKLLQQMERMHEELQTLREQSRFAEAMPPLDRKGRA